MKNPSSQSGRFRSRVLALNLVFVVAALAVARLPHAVAEQGQWTSNGPSTGGAVNTVAVDPRSANVVYAGGTLGLYKSFDGGKTWRPSEAGIPAGTVQTMAIDPSTPTTLFASLSTGAHGIYRSTDAGATWTIAGTGLPNSIVNAVAIHPLHASTIYLGNYNGVFRSGDGGATWVDVGGGLTSKAVLALALDAGDENTLYAGTWDGVFKTTDGGLNWNHLQTGFPSQVSVLSLALDPVNPLIVYAGTEGGGLMKSEDGGANWINIDPHFRIWTRFYAVAIDLRNPQQLYAGTNSSTIKSTDGGTTWQRVGDTLPNAWIYGLAIPPSVSGVVYAATGNTTGGVFRTNDGGVTWAGSAQGFMADTFVTTIIPHPTIPLVVYAAVNGTYGVQRSNDGGLSWRPASERPIGGLLTSLAVAQSDSSTMYAGGIGGFSAFVIRSTDAGETWVDASSGLPSPGEVTEVAVDSTDPEKVYAGTWSNGIYRSTDGGLTWTEANIGLPRSTQVVAYNEISALLSDSASPGTVFAATQGDGLFKSTDGGNVWQPSSLGMGPNVYVRAIAADPSDSATLFVAASNGVTTAIFKTTDAGTLWTLVAPVSTNVNALAVDPVRPATVYLAGDNGVMMSSDGGSTWSSINEGLASNSAKSIAIDLRGATLYAGTAASGVFSRTLTVIPPVQLVSAVSRKTHGDAGTFDVDLPLTGNPGIECRTGGANGDYLLVFSFVNTLTSADGATVTSGNGSVSSAMIDTNDAHNYIVNLTEVTNAQYITVSLSNVADSAGNFSSAVSAQMGVLIGDVNASGVVTSGDTNLCKAQALQPVTSANFRNDVNASGSITTGDVNIIKQNALNSLP